MVLDEAFTLHVLENLGKLFAVGSLHERVQITLVVELDIDVLVNRAENVADVELALGDAWRLCRCACL